MEIKDIIKALQNIADNPANNLTSTSRDLIKTIMVSIGLVDSPFDPEYFERLVEFVDKAEADEKDIPLTDLTDNPEKFLYHARIIENVGLLSNELRINKGDKSIYITDDLPF